MIETAPMTKPEPTFESEQDRQLFKLQLQVAQRADELTRLLKNQGLAFELWRQAESEVLSVKDRAAAHAP
jgi:hypothetical protein